MQVKHLKFLSCPNSQLPLFLKNEVIVNGKIKEGMLLTALGEYRYPIIKYIPRFVSEDNYATNFGIEWNLHEKTQYDDESRHQLSAQRFKNETKWPNKLLGEIILEAGSGSGRFTQQAAKTDAMVISFDYSSAVEANYKSNGDRDNVLIVQADMRNMPFAKLSFDKVLCLGVLQHTPKPPKCFSCLVEMMRPGGSIVVDNYIKNLSKFYLQPKYWVRPFTKRINPKILYSMCKWYVDLMWPLVCKIRKIPIIGVTINWKLLIADYYRELPEADNLMLKEWAYLDTFDMLSPAYDFPVTVSTFKGWFEDEGLQQIDVHEGYNGIEGRAIKEII